MKPVFPIEILEYSTELHRFTYLKKYHIIYIILLLALLTLIAVLPLIRIDIYKTSSGMIRSEKEINLKTNPFYKSNTAEIIFENDSTQKFKTVETYNSLLQVSSIEGASPQTDLVVECYVSPSDMTLIKKNQKVKFQIDAFKHWRWGSVSGQIIKVYRNLVKINNLPMYRILCSLDETNLYLNKTTKAYLQKGMSLRVLFLTENRSLLQLLFD